jgi:hypothetical protein
MNKHGNNPDLKIDISYRGRLYVKGFYKGREVISVYSGGIQSSQSLPVDIEEAEALVALYQSAIHTYLTTSTTDERVLEAVWGEHHKGVKLYE